MLLRQLEHFQSVVREGSFTSAAEKCHISQSAISQSVKALEAELGVELLTRGNRTFSLTDAGEFFYKRSLMIVAGLDKARDETVKISRGDFAKLSIGWLRTYDGVELAAALSEFSRKYPTVEISLMDGNHEELYAALISEKVDLVLNDQRRTFSDEYENLVLAKAGFFLEMQENSPLSALEAIEPADLADATTILVASPGQEFEESSYFRDVLGFKGDFAFAKDLASARLMVAANLGVLPVEIALGTPVKDAPNAKRIPIVKDGKQLYRNLCAFWSKDNSGYYVEEFVDFLQTQFPQIT